MKRYLTIALVAVLLVYSVTLTYTYTSGSGTIGIAEPAGDVATVNATATQPDWDSVLDRLSSDNETCGEVPAGDLFTITPDATYGGDLVAKVYLANTGALAKAYQYLNMKLFLDGSVESGQTPNYRLLSLQNGEAELTIEELEPVSSTWTETSQADFADSTLNQVDTDTSPGDVILDTFTDNVTDAFDNENLIASSANVTVSGGQVKLIYSAGASDNETLRPNAAGDETNIDGEYPLSGVHWTLVDDVTSDEDGTYVETYSGGWLEDLYQTANHAAGSGDINYVKVYMVVRATGVPTQEGAYVHIKTNGGEYNGTAVQVTETYATYSYQWDNNPQTGDNWTWAEIDALQIGVGLRASRTVGGPAGRYTRCTQVYFEVNYAEATYYSSGTVTSVNLLSGETVKSIDGFYYDASAIPAGTSLKVQFSQDDSNWYNSAGALNGWDTLSQGTDTIDLSGLGWLGANFYYHLLFTSDGSDTPVQDEISVIFITYYSSGDLTSSTYDTGADLEWNWGTISFTLTEPSATDVKFQIRTAATEGGLDSATWYGPTDSGDYYQTSGTAINPVHDGDRWIQYKAYFTGPGDDTPTFSDISITDSAQSVVFTIETTGGGYCLISDNTSEWSEGWTVTPEFYCEITQR